MSDRGSDELWSQCGKFHNYIGVGKWCFVEAYVPPNGQLMVHQVEQALAL